MCFWALISLQSIAGCSGLNRTIHAKLRDGTWAHGQRAVDYIYDMTGSGIFCLQK
ncbi:hypothetical protein B0H10DRAFT_2005138 [Mycena sp. CBHHK59/15]|nr:hypothetical protein B0H10DRAFT_2005138 [Mycena sp. CBHHK59/15]